MVVFFGTIWLAEWRINASVLRGDCFSFSVRQSIIAGMVSQRVSESLIEAGLHQHDQLDHAQVRGLTQLLTSLVCQTPWWLWVCLKKQHRLLLKHLHSQRPQPHSQLAGRKI